MSLNAYAYADAIVLEDLQDFCRFDNDSSQGYVGSCTYEGKPKIWKISCNVDFVIEAEYETSVTLSASATGTMPHFCEITHLIRVKTKDGPRACALYEPVRDSQSLGHVLKVTDEWNDAESLLARVLIATSSAHAEIGFTHYDLHVDNILVRPTDVDIAGYITADGRRYVVETNGLEPVIIDYGYSYTRSTERLKCSSYFNDIGLQPYRTNDIADVSVLFACAERNVDINLERGTSKRVSGLCMALLRDSFAKVKSRDVDHGWIENHYSIKNGIESMFGPLGDGRICPSVVSDIVSPLVKLPVTKSSQLKMADIKEAVRAFYAEWDGVRVVINDYDLEEALLKRVVEAMIAAEGGDGVVDKTPFRAVLTPDQMDIVTTNLYTMAQGLSDLIWTAQKFDDKRRVKTNREKKIKSSIEAADELVKLMKEPKIVRGDVVKIYDCVTKTVDAFTVSRQDLRVLRKNPSIFDLRDTKNARRDAKVCGAFINTD